LQPLEVRIRDSLIASAGSHEKFLPKCDLEEIITLENIKVELKRSRRVVSDIDFIAQQVLEPPVDQVTSRRRIFAILCLLQKAPKIQAFIEEAIFDCDLPFDFGTRGRSDSSEGFNPPPKLFKSWKPKNVDGFDQYQGQLLAPYFKLSNNNSFSFSEQKLHHSVVLPFVEYEVKDRILGKTIQGGFSEVRIVKIHRAHHDYLAPLPQQSAEDFYFAVKQLQNHGNAPVTTEKERIQEVQAYKRLNYIQHPHLTRLLATYTHRKHLHLVFPYATGDLHNFWYDHFPKPTEALRNHRFVRWMSKQLVGIAQALHTIHHCDVQEFVTDHSSIDAAKTHGRHGDLKPENILWFPHESSGSEEDFFGVLKISDFGFAEFHSPLSLSVEASGVGGITPTYKAPEFDMNRISPKYDIWSLGCIILQFVVWYLRGWDGVERFSKTRMDESNRLDHPDDFFNFYRTRPDEEVLEIDSLRDHPSSSDFILDLVDFIESRLLRMNAKSRATCDETFQKLKKIDSNCRESIEYCTQRRKAITKTATDLSDRIEVKVSAKMREEIIETIDPSSPILPEAIEWPEQRPSTSTETGMETIAATEASSSPGTTVHSFGTVPDQVNQEPDIGIGLRILENSSEQSNNTRIDPPNNAYSTNNGVSHKTANGIGDKPEPRNRFKMWLRKLLRCFV
ncbi:kinase-like protein, partial [Cucurbitaria berberidis CBS 394.84]